MPPPRREPLPESPALKPPPPPAPAMHTSVRSFFLACCLTLLFSAGVGVAEEPPTHEIDFSQATGISAERLAELVDTAMKTGLPDVPLEMIVRDANDTCLVNAKVTALWDGGTQEVSVLWTGQITIPLNRERTKGLKLRVPAAYTRLKQTSFAEGSGYQAPTDFSDFSAEVVNDPAIKARLLAQLIELRRQQRFTPIPELMTQLQRSRCTLALPAAPAQSLTPAQIYQQCKPAVVIMAKLGKMSQIIPATGVIIGAGGIVVTNYHVVTEQADLTDLIGAMLADGRVVAVREVLAADRANDLAIVRIDADNLPHAPLSRGEPVGTPVSIIAHPDQRFWFLTDGGICRYSRAMYAGEERVYMEVSAEFMPGSSGGPAFAPDGSVAGIVSTIVQNGKGMVFRQCIPVQSIRRLIESPK